MGAGSGDRSSGPYCYDITPPTVTCPTADGLWHAADVSLVCHASDSLSGLANPSDASFSLSTSVPTGTETSNAFTGSRTVFDVAGNSSTAGPIGGNMVDKKAPSITITTPSSGASYTLNQVVLASYGCADGGSGVATCVGTVPTGSKIDTASVGAKSFGVNATDKVANASSSSLSYNVTYKICLQYDPTVASGGRSYIITLQLCDFNNVNVSKASIQVTATAVDGAPSKLKALGNLNPGNVFLYGPGTSPGASYTYNLDTQGLGAGSHVLNFTVQGDPIAHTAPFIVKK